jgi:hypothetical protein
MNGYTEDHLVEQPAIQIMKHELGWDVVNCYDEWSGGTSNQPSSINPCGENGRENDGVRGMHL